MNIPFSYKYNLPDFAIVTRTEQHYEFLIYYYLLYYHIDIPT